MNGINIFSGNYEDWLGAALTNPTVLSKKKGNIILDYPVIFDGEYYPDAEAAYQDLKKTVEPDKRLDLMVDIIAEKLKQNPRLLNAIKGRGGEDFLASCRHFTYAKTESFQWWEGEGLDSPMIRCLYKAYCRWSR